MQKRYKHIIFPSNPVAKSVAVIAGNTVVKDIVIVQAGIDKVGDYMDNEFINGIVAQGNAAPTGIKCRGGHPNMCKDSLGTYIGDYHNFRAIEQDGLYKAVADLYIAEIAKKTMIEGHGISYHDYVVEMAKNHPDKLGNSIVFTADSEYVKQEDGTEYYKLSLVQFRASDIVDSPAATDGLFKSDDDIGIKMTEFLDENPEVLEAISKNENAIEIFFKKYANHSQINKSNIMSLLDKVKSTLGIKPVQKNIDVTDATGQILTVVTDANDPQVGDAVEIQGTPAPDGEYTFPDGSKWQVTGGKIESITAAPAADPTPAPADPQPVAMSEEAVKSEIAKGIAAIQKEYDQKLEAFKSEVEQSLELIMKNMKSDFVPPVGGKEGSEGPENKSTRSGKTVAEVAGIKPIK